MNLKYFLIVNYVSPIKHLLNPGSLIHVHHNYYFLTRFRWSFKHVQQNTFFLTRFPWSLIHVHHNPFFLTRFPWSLIHVQHNYYFLTRFPWSFIHVQHNPFFSTIPWVSHSQSYTPQPLAQELIWLDFSHTIYIF